MSFATMTKTLAGGEIPGVAQSLVRTKINEALQKIYDETDWSFQTGQAGWNNPGLMASSGTVTATPYSQTVVGDATASAVWAAISGRPSLTEVQFRNPSYALYNIIAYDTTSNAPFGTLTLDRPWMEPTSGAGQPYQIYQCYFPVPYADFTKFVEIRDTTNNAPVSFTEVSQDDLSVMDAQRLIFGPAIPTYAVPWGVDQRLGSATLGFTMYEIWPHNLSHMPYSFSFKRSGPLLVNPSDTVPSPLSEDLLTWRAKEILYQYKEAQKGENMQRGAGADWRFLAQAAAKEYDGRLKQVRAKDANLHRDFVTRTRSGLGLGPQSNDGYSNNSTGTLNIGRANW
jgi:hypothetical protein